MGSASLDLVIGSTGTSTAIWAGDRVSLLMWTGFLAEGLTFGYNMEFRIPDAQGPTLRILREAATLLPLRPD